MITRIKAAFLSDKRARRMLWAALACAVLISGWRALMVYDVSSLYVRVSMKSPVTGTAELYYDVGRQFNANHVSAAAVYGDGKFHSIKLRIPSGEKYFNLRLDPPPVSHGEIAINKMDVVDYDGSVLHTFKLSDLKPANQIKKFDFVDNAVRFSTEEAANDPQIRIVLDRPISFNRLHLCAVMLLYHILPEFLILLAIGLLLIYIWSRGTDSVIVFMILLAILAAGWVLHHETRSVNFRLSMQSSVRGDYAELFYDRGFGLSPTDSLRTYLHEADQFHEYTFRVPRDITHLRLDPSTKAGTVVMKNMEITDRFGNVLQSFKPDQLSPANEIKTFESTAEGFKATTTDASTDAQILIMLDEAWQRHSRPVLHIAVVILFEWLAILAILILCGYIWKRKERIYGFIGGAFVQEKLPLLYTGCAFGLILAMVFLGGKTANPDEWSHVVSAGYYIDSWLPGAVDDPRVLKTVGGWGISYLFRVDAAYWLAGKFSALLSGLVYDDYLRTRLFNAALFFILGLIITRRVRNVPLLSLVVVVSPQIWYVFSYFNGDAFPFFLSIIIAWQLIDPESLTRQFLDSDRFKDRLSGGIFFGVLAGLMLLSKLNYYLYLAFALFVIVWHFVFEQENRDPKSDRYRLGLKKGILIAGVALCIYIPPMAYHQYIHDFDKNGRILAVAERHAEYPFKPSTLKNDVSSSYKCLRLRDRGVTFEALFIQNPEWRNWTFESFFGLYGNMDIHSDAAYFQAVKLVLGLFFLSVFLHAISGLPARDVLFMVCVLCFAVLAVGQSVYNSWVVDYEPQGRYVFPILPMLIIGLTKLPPSFRTRVVPLFCLIFFLVSTWSFLWTAIKLIPKLSGC